MSPPTAADDRKSHHLAIALSAAVPLWVMELSKRPLDELLAEAAKLAQVVAEKGDVIQFRGRRTGETAAAFNALARGIAILSFTPGGITVFGLHFENEHPDSKGSRSGRS